MKQLTFDLMPTIAKGLRTSERSIVNQPGCEVLIGAFPDGDTLEFDLDLTPIILPPEQDLTFPYPQIFACASCLIACTPTAIYEYANGLWLTRISGLTAGVLWSVADFVTFMAFTNGKQTVVRTWTGAYEVTTTIPTGSSICAVGGQIIVGAAGSIVPGSNIDLIGLEIAEQDALLGTLTLEP